VDDRGLAIALGRPEPDRRLPTGPELDRLGRQAEPSASAERALVEAAKAGDPGARARLVEAYIPRIAALARIYRGGPGIEHVELLQEGVMGLLRALERYDPDRGPFWPYAAWWVRQAMQQLVAELTRPAVLSDRSLRQLARLKDAYRASLRDTRRSRRPQSSRRARGSTESTWRACLQSTTFRARPRSRSARMGMRSAHWASC
jgi:RNA polymerase sigma factor (sigma-70 family)